LAERVFPRGLPAAPLNRPRPPVLATKARRRHRSGAGAQRLVPRVGSPAAGV